MTIFLSRLLTRMEPVSKPPAADERNERDAFALRIKVILETIGITVVYDTEEFALRMGNGSVSWLANRFDEFQRAPEGEREGIVLHVARGIVDAGRPSPVLHALAGARPNLRPRIRQQAHLVILGLQMEDGGHPSDAPLHAYVPLSTDLGVEVVYDTPNNIVSIPTERLQGWGLTPAEALAIAVENLRQSTPDPFGYVGDGVFVAAVGDCYDSARLLLTDEIASLPLEGEPVALPANRDTLVITGANNLGGLYRMLQIAMSVLDRPRMDTLQPVVLRNGVWCDWLPPVEHPMREAFYELAVRNRGTSYAELKDLLVRRHARDGRELFVASYGVLPADAGQRASSHAVWAPVRGWLPESDLISVIHPEDGRYIVVPRDKVVSVAGHLLAVVPEVHPPYHAFEGGPSLGLWNDLRVFAVREGVMER